VCLFLFVRGTVHLLVYLNTTCTVSSSSTGFADPRLLRSLGAPSKIEVEAAGATHSRRKSPLRSGAGKLSRRATSRSEEQMHDPDPDSGTPIENRQNDAASPGGGDCAAPADTGSPPPRPQLLTVAEASARLRVPPSWLYRAAADGRFPCVRVGRYVRIRAVDVELFIDTGGDELAIGDAHPAEGDQRRVGLSRREVTSPLDQYSRTGGRGTE
jgi:excisionase family DNA binding protein